MSGHHQLSVPEYKAHPQLLVFTGMKKSAPYTPELTVPKNNFPVDWIETLVQWAEDNGAHFMH